MEQQMNAYNLSSRSETGHNKHTHTHTHEQLGLCGICQRFRETLRAKHFVTYTYTIPNSHIIQMRTQIPVQIR